MPDTDPLELLRAANPISQHSAPRPQLAPDTLFQQITTMETDVVTTGSPAKQTRRRWRPFIAMPAAAAVVGLVVGGAVLLEPGRTPSASALVADAAATSASFESGRVTVAVEIEESPGDDSSGRFVIEYRFDQGDYSLHFDGSRFGEAAPEGGTTLVVGEIDVRGVGDQSFSSWDGSKVFVAEPRSDDSESIEALFGFQPTAMEPATAVALLERTDDFEAVTSDDGMTTYRGSVTLASIEALGPESLPAGLSMLADPDTPNDDLPDTLGVDVVVANGLLDTVTIEIDGETELGYAKGTITTTFAGYGEPQNIVAPPADQISDDVTDGFEGLPEGFEEALAVLDELEGRRPGLCSDVFTDQNGDVADDELLAQIEAFPVCLEDAGEQGAADAFRSLDAFGD